MSETIIKKLLKGANVEWIRLGERLKRTTGTSITAGKMKELHKSYGALKIFGGGKTYALVNFNDIPEKDINKYPSIIVKSRGVIEFDYYNKPFSHKNELWSYHSEDKYICVKYIYYYMKTKEAYFQHLGNKMQMPQISIQDTDKFPVPIPPLSVQKEIVRILDVFTAHTAELTAELNERKKQYNYYLNKLLTFSDDEVEWTILKEVAKLKNGKDWKNLNYGRVPVFGTGGIIGYVDTFSYDKPSVLIPRKGSLNNVFYLEEPFWNVDTIYYTVINEKIILPKFFYYFIKNFNIEKLDTGSSRPSLTQAILNKIPIPIPSLSVQKEIVRKLDAFSTLTTSISEGLPREIELRNKQYEYYRDQLLNFPKPDLEI